MLKKIISVMVSVTFVFSVVTVDIKAATVPLPVVNSNDVFKLNDAGILKNFAKVTSLKNFNSDTVVLNIQDFHMHPGVQQNINSIIKALVDNYSVKNVYLEGAYDEVNTNWLTNIANQDLKKAIIKELTKDGKLTGAEIYSVNNNKQDFILPLEDKNLHKENIKRLARILGDKPEVLNKLDKIEKELLIYQKKYLSGNNKNFTEVIQKHDAGEIDTGKYYKLLFAYLKKNAKPSKNKYGNIVEMTVNDYPNINRYLQAYQLQNKIKLKELSKDLKALMEVLKKELSYEEYNKIITSTNNLSDIDALIASLVVLPSEYKQKYATKQLQDFVEATRIYKEINPVELINEERALIEQIRGALSKNKAELEISFLTDFFKYFKDFMIANISADNRQYFSEKKDEFIILWNKYSFYNQPMQELVKRIPFINEYYDVNDYRNEVFIKKISLNNKTNSNSELPVSSFSSLINGKNLVVVITGGYHTKGLTDLLFKNNVSYAVITPAVSGSIGNTYQKYEAAVKEEAKINSQTLASAAISLIGLEQSYVIELLKQIQKDNNFNLDDIVRFIEVLNETKEQKINYEYDAQKQVLQLSDGNTQIIITKDDVKVNSLTQTQDKKAGFDVEKVLKEINKNIKVFSSSFSFFSTGIFYPDLFETLDGFETFLIERNLMPAITNGLIYEIDKDEQFKEYILKQDEDGLIKLAQKTYNVQYEILAKYYKEKDNEPEQTEENISVNNVYDSIEGKQPSFVTDDLLANAKIGGYAVGAFNMNNLDQLMAIVDAAVEANSPLMIEISEGALGYSADNPMGMEKFNYLVEVYRMIAATRPDLEMILHLDHAKNIDVAKKAIDMGFSSVMLDYSKKEISENKQATKELVEYAHKTGARVEAEIGAVDLGDQGYTTPEQALDFVKATGVDSLAIAVGTAHGANKNNPQLQFMLIAEIAYELYKNGIKTPLVLHGASAVPEDKIIRFNGAGGEKENASGVPMTDTKAAIKWKTLLDEAKEDIEKKAKQDKSFNYKAAEDKLKIIEKEITEAGLLEQGVISKVNVATDLLVAGATNMREQVYTQNLANSVIAGTVITEDMLSKSSTGINHKFEQEETTKLVVGKMNDLGSSRKIEGNLNKKEIDIPKSKLKSADELKNKDSVIRYNVGSIEEIQAVVNNVKDSRNIIFTIDENTKQRYDYSNKDGDKNYNALIFAIEVAARYNEDINFAVEIVNTKNIDNALTEILIDILENSCVYNEQTGKLEIDTNKIDKAELVYLKNAMENKKIINLQAIADYTTQKYLKENPSQHDVRKWGEEYRNKIWVLADALDNGYIFKDINDDDYDGNNRIESADEVSVELNNIGIQGYDDEFLNEIRTFDNILEGKIAQNTDKSDVKEYKPQFAVYAAGGRIGQPNVWSLAERKDVELSMITVSPRLSKDEVPYSISHDSGLRVQEGEDTIHGDFNGDVRWCKENELTESEKEKYNEYKRKDEEKIKKSEKGVFLGYLRMESRKTGKVSHVAVFQTYNPEDIDFSGKIVLNTSGKYKTEEETKKLFKVGEKNGAKKVLLSAPPEPGKMPVLTNATRQNFIDRWNVTSGASCTTNNIHIALLLIGQVYDISDPYVNDNGEIVYPVEFDGHHARTNSEGKKEYDKERHSSGAGIATSLIEHPVLQSLDGKVNGSVIRVGNRYDGSSAILTIKLKEPVKGKNEEERVAEINKILKNASENEYNGMLGYTEEDWESDNPKKDTVSKDIGKIINSTDAGMVLAKHTRVKDDGKTIELEIWYDNETGYANQYLNLAIYAGRFKKVKDETIKLLEAVGVNTENLKGDDVSFKEIYKVLRYEVMANPNKMTIIKKEADKGNYVAQTIVELAEKLGLQPYDAKIDTTTEKETKQKDNKEIKLEKYKINEEYDNTTGTFTLLSTVKSVFSKIFGNNVTSENIDVDLIYVENFQDLPRTKRNIFDKNNNKITLYVSLIKNNDVNQEKQLVPSGIDNKNIQINKDTGVIYISDKKYIDSVTSNIATILNNSMGIDDNNNFSIVISDETSNDKDKNILSVNDGGVIKTSTEFTNAARNIVKTLTGVMNRNLVVMLEGNKNDIDTQLDIMEKIGNKTITLPAEYFDKKDIYVIKSCISNLAQHGINVIIEYNETDAKIKNAYKLGFAGHIVTSVDAKGVKSVTEYENYSLNEKVDVQNNCRILPDIDSLKQFNNIKSSNETVFINGAILKDFVKGRDFLQVRELLNGLVVNFVKFFNENIDEKLIENFVFELPNENIPELSETEIWQLNEKLKIRDSYALRESLGIDSVPELMVFEGKILNLSDQQNKDKEQMLLVYYENLLKAAQIKNRVYKQYPLGFKDRNIQKLVEKNALVELNQQQQQELNSIIEIVREAAKKMNAADFEEFVYELAYSLDGQQDNDIQTAQKLLNSIGFAGEIKEGPVAKAAVFELLVLFADKKIGNVDFEREDFDDIKNVVNILTAA